MTTTTPRPPLAQRQLARFTDWQRPKWVNMTHAECLSLVRERLLETRYVPAYRGGAWEYRLTAAGADLVGADKPPSKSSVEKGSPGHRSPTR